MMWGRRARRWRTVPAGLDAYHLAQHTAGVEQHHMTAEQPRSTRSMRSTHVTFLLLLERI